MFLNIMDINGDQRLKVQTAVLLQLQRALYDPSRGIRVLSRKEIGHLKKKNVLKCIYFLTPNARLALA